jgi:DNA-binding response OmpR family regulator
MGMEKPSDYTLTIDDDPTVHRIIEVITATKSLSFHSAASFLSRGERYAPQAVFVDVNLGVEMSGLDLIPRIRDLWPYCPILVITSTPDDDAVGQALAAGANDFVKKPLSGPELLARLRARAIEMAGRARHDSLEIGDLRLNLRLRRLESLTGTSPLSPSETQLLEYLIQARGATVNKAELKRRLWGNLKVSDNALDKKIYDVRQALRDLSTCVSLESSYGKGIHLTVKLAHSA